ncbi:MAG: leucine-rich repeat protein [Clostridia bacterium]|nr:leucine-rich repeat protein [Clostridia bacterium]
MKKLSLVLVLLVLAMFAIPAQADVTLPDNLTVIEAQAFMNDKSLTGALIIPEGVTEIGAQAFKGCTGLTSVTFPSTLRSIGSEAFAGCTGLNAATYVLPSDVTVETDAFLSSGATVLQENPASDFSYIVSVDEVMITGYRGKKPIGYLVIPATIEGYPVTAIGDSAFIGQTTMTGLYLPDSVNYIDWCAFYSCSNLHGVFLINGTIANNAFSYCPNAEAFAYMVNADQTATITRYSSGKSGTVTIPSFIQQYPVTALSNYVFQNYNTIEAYKLPANLVSIGAQCFTGNSALTSITLPETVRSIGEGCFSGCSALSSITFPAAPITLDLLVFSSCTNLTGQYYYQGTALARSFTYCPGAFIAYSVNDDGSAAITGFGGEASSAEIPSYIGQHPVTVIKTGAIRSINTLESLTLPSTLTSIEAMAINMCSNLQLTAHLNDGVIVSNSVNGFSCPNVQLFSYKTNDDGTAALTCFSGAGAVTIPSHYSGHPVTSIGEQAFLSGQITDVLLPESVSSIGRYAFAYSTISSINLENVKDFGDSVFLRSSIESVVFPAQVNSINHSMFQECTQLRNVTLPENITEIPRRMFYSCTALESITLPESVTYLGWTSFAETTSLTSINLDNITETHNSVFTGSKLLSDAAAKVAAQVVTADMSDFEKAKALHDWVVNNTTYYRIVAGPEGTFFMDGGSCMSYTQAYGLLLDQVGIENLYIEAPDEMAHIWNLIKLDGEWYHVDCTWDDGGDILTYEYFCLSDELMKQDHSWPYDNYPAANGSRYTNGVDHGE